MNEDIADKRLVKRQALRGAVADLASDRFMFSDCLVSDVSANGLRVQGIPFKMIKRLQQPVVESISAVISLKDHHVRVTLMPKWFKQDTSLHLTVGFEVVGNNGPWYDFVRVTTSLAKHRQGDIWGIGGEKYLRAQIGDDILVMEFNT